MSEHLYTHRKTSYQSESIPQQSPFQPRPFVVQPQTEEQSEQPDIKTALQRAERYGHNLSQINPAGVSSATAVQPKAAIGRSGVIQCQGGSQEEQNTDGSRHSAVNATAGSPQGSVGYAMNTVASALHTALGNFADGTSTGRGIGHFVNSESFQGLANQSASGPAGRTAAELEQQYWQSAAGQHAKLHGRINPQWAVMKAAGSLPVEFRYQAQRIAASKPVYDMRQPGELSAQQQEKMLGIHSPFG